MQFNYRATVRFMARQFVRLAGIGLASILSLSSASAQVNEKELLEAVMSKIAGTQRVYAQPAMTGGKLQGCSLIFEAMIRDFTYRQGQFIKVDGSIGIMDVSGSLGAVLKVVVNEITPPSLTFNPSPPSRAYLIGSDYATNVDSLISADESDTPGALFSIFQPSPTVGLILTALQSKKITVAFNKKGGLSDIQLSLELDVEHTDAAGTRTRSDQAVTDFSQCMLVLFEQLEQ